MPCHVIVVGGLGVRSIANRAFPVLLVAGQMRRVLFLRGECTTTLTAFVHGNGRSNLVQIQLVHIL